jgi:uncharacterized membrane protein
VQPEPSPPPPETIREGRVLFWGNLGLAACVVGYLGYVFASSGTAGMAELAGVAGFSFAVAGKLVIFYGLRNGAIPVWSLAVMTFLIDLVLASALASGLRGLERAPLVGGWLHNSRSRAKEVLLEYPGLRRMAFFGVVAFVLLPIAGTGAITGSIVARLMGLSRLSGIGAIALASGWSALCFALLATFLGEQGETLIKNPLIVTGVAGLLGAVGVSLYKRFVAELRRKG